MQQIQGRSQPVTARGATDRALMAVTARVMLEGGGAGGADAEFSVIAQSVYQMWLDLHRAHSWW